MPRSLKRPQPGEPIDGLVKSAGIWSVLVDMIADYTAGRLGTSDARSKRRIWLSNSNPVAFAPGEFARVNAPAIPDDDAVLETWFASPVLPIVPPAFPGSLYHCVPLTGGCDIGEAVPYPHGLNWAVVKAAGRINDLDNLYAVLDPNDAKKVYCSRSGLWKVLAYHDDSEQCIIDLRAPGQPWFRYERKSASNLEVLISDDENNPIGGAGELQAEVTLYDPLDLMDDQEAGNLGWCYLSGGKFRAKQAPC